MDYRNTLRLKCLVYNVTLFCIVGVNTGLEVVGSCRKNVHQY